MEVPPQTSPAQIELEEERIGNQQTLLENARDAASDLDVGVRTRAIVGRNAGETLRSVIEDEDADHALLGWAGERRRRDVLFGSTIDPLLERAPCDVTLVKQPSESPGEIVTLAGSGPNAPVSAQRARELSRAFPESTLTLLNVQAASDDDEIDPVVVGEQAIEAVADEVGLEPDEYEPRVIIADSDGVRERLITAAASYDTVCVGATGTSPVAQALYGTIPEQLVEASDGTVLMARGEQRSPRTLRQALIQRLEGSA